MAPFTSTPVVAAVMCVVALAVCGGVRGEGAALDLGADTFAAETAKGPLFVKFFAPWCGHCKRLAPTWDELAGTFNSKGGTRIGKVDCTIHKPLCSEHGIRGYPTLKLFKDGEVIDYSGGRSVEALGKWVGEQDGAAPAAADDAAAGGDAADAANGLFTATDATFKATVGSKFAFVKFYAPWCGHCKKLAPTWDELAAKFGGEGDVRIVRVDCTQNSATCTEYGIRGYPTLVLFKDGEKSEKYSGGRTLEALSAFLDDQGAPAADAGAGGDAGAAAPAGDVEVTNGLMVLTDASFAAGVAKGYSFVKFYAPWCGHCKRLAPVWDELASAVESLPVGVGKVDCTQHSAVCSKYEVRGYPTLLLFKDGEKAEKYSGGRTLDALKSFLLEKAGHHDEL